MVVAAAGFLAGLGVGWMGLAKTGQGGFCPSPEAKPVDARYIESKLTAMYRNLNPFVYVVVTNVSPPETFFLHKVRAQVMYEGQTLNEFEYYTDGQLLFPSPVLLDAIRARERVKVSEDDDPSRGSGDRVVIVMFSDYACPFCREMETEVIPRILSMFNDTVRVVFRDFPVHGEASYLAAMAANCAGEQGRYWEYHDILFERQSEWLAQGVDNVTFVKEKLTGYAGVLGLNVESFRACLDSGKYREEVEKDLQDGQYYGVRGVPTLFLNGFAVAGLTDLNTLAELIRKELTGSLT